MTDIEDAKMFFRKNLSGKRDLVDLIREYVITNDASDAMYNSLFEALAEMERSGELLVSNGVVHYTALQ